MPHDPNLYGQPPPKRQKKAADLSSSLSFASQVTALLSAPPASSPGPGAAATGRARPSRSKTDIFSGARVRRKQKPDGDNPPGDAKLTLRSPQGTEDDKAERQRARRRMEEKARLYAAMRRGDYVAREGEAAPLVDFDRKWAEAEAQRAGGSSSGSGTDDDDDDDDDVGDDGLGNDNDNDTELVEYEDEFGRLRRGTRAERLRHERRVARGAGAAAELERMSARPRAPEGLIYGDAVQAAAFAAADEARMAELAARRDRSATPPEAVHYRADREIRTKGTGFYAFSADDEAARRREMDALAEERAATERARREREERMAARRREVEERRRQVGEKRARKMAESFLDGLGRDLEGGVDGAGKGTGEPQVQAGPGGAAP